MFHDESLVTDLVYLPALTPKKPYGATVVADGGWSMNVLDTIDKHNSKH